MQKWVKFLFGTHLKNIHLSDIQSNYREGNEPGDKLAITYRQLLDEVIAFSGVLRQKGLFQLYSILSLFQLSIYGVKRGDRVVVYLPMIIELPIAMLSCARIGAIHSVVVR